MNERIVSMNPLGAAWLQNGKRSCAEATNFRIIYPLSLTFLRLALGPIAIGLAMFKPDIHRWWFGLILLGGLLSDYFDGVIARRLDVARAWLRRFDSATDVIFYLSIFASACILSGDTLRQGCLPIAILLTLEIACLAVSLLRFRTLPATHCYSAKFYGLCLFIVFVGVLCFRWGSWCLWPLAVVGMVSGAEVLLVLCMARQAPVDVLFVMTWCKAQKAGVAKVQ